MLSPIQITSENLVVDEHNTPTVLVLHFNGQLDETNVDQQAKVVYELIDSLSADTRVVLDFAGLTYMNSKSIGYLTDWHMKMQQKGGEIVLAQPRENILDILNVVGLTQIVHCFSTLDEAIESVVAHKQA